MIICFCSILELYTQSASKRMTMQLQGSLVGLQGSFMRLQGSLVGLQGSFMRLQGSFVGRQGSFVGL